MSAPHSTPHGGKLAFALILGLLALLIYSPSRLVAGEAAPKYRPGQAEAAAPNVRTAGGPDEDLRVYEPAKVFGIPSAAAALVSPGTVVGETYYDFQHNASTGRQVDEFNGIIQASYMRQSLPQLSPGRRVFWNRVSVTGSAAPYVLDNGGTIRKFPLGVPATPIGTAVGTEDQQGYTTLRLTPNGRATVIYHAIGALGSWAAGLESTAGSGAFTVNVAPQPVTPVVPVVWPHSAVDVVGGDTVLHVVATGSVNTFEVWYWRGLVTAGTSAVTWSSPVLLDTTNGISAVVEADPTSDKVAVVYTRSTEKDIVYRLSTDGGQSWGPMINVTNYSGPDTQRAADMVAAIFDEDGILHVVYDSFTESAGGQLIPAMLWHWNSVRQTSRMIAAAYWQNTCSQTSPYVGDSHDRQLARPNISVKPAGAGPGGGIADKLLYTVWVQFGPTQTDCATQADGTTPGGWVNGELWCSVSSDEGLTWDPPQNITGTETPGCGLGNCHSEHWVSAAASADSGVYLSYVDDTHAGGIPNDEGGWSLSPYKVLALEARTPALSPRLVVLPVEPASWTLPYWGNEIHLPVLPAGVTTDQISITNPGTAQLNFTASIVNNGSVLNIPLVNGVASYNSSIAAGGAPETLTVSYDPVSTLNYVDFQLQITSNATAAHRDLSSTSFTIKWMSGVLADQQWQPLGLGVNGPVYALTVYGGKLIAGGYFGSAGGNSARNIASWDGATWNPLDTGLGGIVRGLAVYNNKLYACGTFGGNQVASWDGSSWSALPPGAQGGYAFTEYNGQLMVAPLNGGQIKSWNGTSWNPPILSLLITISDYIFTMAEYNGKLYAGGNGQYFGSPTDPKSYIASYDGISSSWGPLGSGLNAYSIIRALVVHDGKLIVGGNFYSFDASTFNIASWNGTAWGGLGNLSWVYALAEYDNELIASSLSPGYINSWDGALWNPLGSGMDNVANAMTVYGDKLIVGGAITQAGNRLVNNIAAWNKSNSCPIVITGDLNLSGAITSADVITLVNYVFKSGLVPQPCAAAGDINCNGSVTSADVISLVNHVFKSGTPPCNACTSALAAGC